MSDNETVNNETVNDVDASADPVIEWVTIRVPVIRNGSARIGNVQTFRFARSNTGARSALAAAFDGLRTSHAQLPCGKHVDKIADAFKWVLEEIAAQM